MIKENNNIPKLRFKEFSEEWENAKLGEIGGLKGGGTPPSNNEEFWKGKIPWISSSDILENDIHNITITRFITEDAILKSATKIIPKNSILIVSRVGIGKFAVSNEEICTSQDFSNFLPIDQNAYFLAYYFTAKKNKFISLSQGTSIKGFTGKDIRNLNFSIPNSLKEQQKIANFLTTVDTKINQLQKKKSLLQDYKKGVMQQIFSQKLRFKPVLSEAEGDSNGKDYPAWEEKMLGELNIYISDGNYGEQYPKASEMKKSGVPFIRANNIKSLNLVWNDMKYIDKELHKVLLSGHLKTDDILVTTRGNIGVLAYVTKEFNNANINAQICLLRCDESINSHYLIQCLSFDNINNQFKKLQTGSALKQLPRKNLKKIKVPLPNIKEQTQIANFLSVIDTKIDLVNTQLENTQVFKKGLLQQMFV